MKVIDYRHNWSSDLTDEQEKSLRFGELLVGSDTADSYETDSAELRVNDEDYNLLFASGCSCWDGDYSGWKMNKDELHEWASKQEPNGWRENGGCEYVVARWIEENL